MQHLKIINIIDRIVKVYGLDSLGFPEEVQKNYENIIDEYTKDGKIEVTGVTGVSQLYNQLKGIKLTHLQRTDDLGWLSELFGLHPISGLRNLYKAINIKEGALDRQDSKNLGILVNYLANMVSLPRDRYTDIKTGLDFKITEKTDGLSIDEFLEKYNGNFEWDNGEIVEKIKKRTLKEDPEYLVRGCVIGCSLGSHKRRVDLRKCHGVYLKEGPALHLEDCVVGEEDNIKSFGLCTRRNTSNMTNLEKFFNNTSDLYPECTPIIFQKWLYAYDNTYIVRNDAESFNEKYSIFDLLNALTENSFLVCAYGGLIEPVTSGQEYEKGNMQDRVIDKQDEKGNTEDSVTDEEKGNTEDSVTNEEKGKLDNQEEELVTLDSGGRISVGANVENENIVSE